MNKTIENDTSNTGIFSYNSNDLKVTIKNDENKINETKSCNNETTYFFLYRQLMMLKMKIIGY